ncbi:hypothetical protein GCM10027047_32500 [Rhodococcus aerolatus]
MAPGSAHGTGCTVTGYGRAALDALREAVLAAKAGDPLAPVTVLVPSGVAGMVARRHLAAGLGDGHAGVAALHPTTVVRHAEQLAAPTLAGRRPATGPVLAAAWRAALEHDPGGLAPVAEHPSTVRALVRAGRELRDLDDDALDAVAWVPPLGSDLVRLHRDVRHRLAAWYDDTDLLDAAAALCRTRPARAAETGPVVLHLPQALTRAECRFVEALRTAVDVTVVAGLTGEPRADGGVLRTLDRVGLPAPAGPTTGTATATAVLTASDSDDEVRCVVRQVVAALRTTPAHRVAVLHAARSPYARLLHEHLAAAGITVNGPGTRPVHERAVARTVLELLELGPRGLPRGELFRALSAAPVRTRDGARVPVSRWERLSRAAGVVAGDDWDTRLRRHADDERGRAAAEQAGDDPSPGRVAALERSVADADALRAFATGLRDDLARGAALTSWAELGGWALDLVAGLVGELDDLGALPADERYAAVALDSALRGLTTLDAFGATASLPALVQTLTEQLETAQPRVGRFGDGVLVAPVAAGVGLDADVVFVLGLAEGLFPTRLREDPLLPERLREQSLGQLVSTRERLDAEHRGLLAALAAAPVVHASFPRGDLRTKSRYLPSRWLLPSLRALSGEAGLTAGGYDEHGTGWLTESPSYASSLTTTAEPASEHEWRTRAAHDGTLGPDEVVRAARALITARDAPTMTRFDGDLTAVADGLPDYSTRAVSPTSLERYAGCPHAFLVRELLRVSPLESPEDVVVASPADVGTLVHGAFDALVREDPASLPGYGEPWSDEHRRRLAAHADRLGADLVARGLAGHPRLWAQLLDRVQGDLALMLDDDDAWRAAHGARVVDSELAFGMDGHPPVPVPLPDGSTVLLRGKADKVDADASGRLWVTDVKTGSAWRFEGLGEDDPVAGGTKLQLPVYAHAARARHGDPGTPVEAQYWFVGPKDRGARVELTLTDAVEHTYAATLATLTRSIGRGLFPPRPPADPDFLWVQCDYCNPDGLGHGEARTRWLRAKHDPRLAELVALVEPVEKDA